MGNGLFISDIPVFDQLRGCAGISDSRPPDPLQVLHNELALQHRQADDIRFNLTNQPFPVIQNGDGHSAFIDQRG
ncbi:hypothetical protein D3C73_1291020 [compost metagenome]